MNSRINQLVESVNDADLEMDALLVVDETNVRYLSGFTGDSSWLLVPSTGTPTILSDRRYETQIAAECPSLETAIRPPSQKMGELLSELLAESPLRRIGIESDHVRVSTLRTWEQDLQQITWVETSEVVEALRAIKDENEISTIRNAIGIAQRSFLSVTSKLTPKMTELELAHELEATMRSLGASGVSFEPIVGAEPSGALPHYHPGATPLGQCRSLLIDWGAKLDGYCSDLTRTLFRSAGGKAAGGATNDRYIAAYEAVLAAQEAAIETIRDGIEASAVDAVARQSLEKAGFGEAFKHGLGHGFGLQIHEEPRMGPMATQTLQAGMVITVEPGVYFEGDFGIRIEDDLLVTSDGCQRLSDLPKGLDDCLLVM